MPPIDPARLYSFTEAAALIPSPRGPAISVRTLYLWREQGKLGTAVQRNGFYWLRGDEVRRLADGEPVAVAGEAARTRVAARSKRVEELRSRQLGLNF